MERNEQRSSPLTLVYRIYTLISWWVLGSLLGIRSNLKQCLILNSSKSASALIWDSSVRQVFLSVSWHPWSLSYFPSLTWFRFLGSEHLVEHMEAKWKLVRTAEENSKRIHFTPESWTTWPISASVPMDLQIFSSKIYLPSREGKTDFGFFLFQRPARRDYLEADFLGGAFERYTHAPLPLDWQLLSFPVSSNKPIHHAPPYHATPLPTLSLPERDTIHLLNCSWVFCSSVP